LREPLKRMVSIFNYCTIVHPSQFRHATLKDFVTSDEALGFTQAASLLRCSGSTPQPDRDDQLYSLASKELAEGYSLVGITELFEETIFAICRLAGYREIAMWWPILAAPQTSSVADLSHAESEKLRRLLAVDFQLYEDARARFVKTCEALDLSGCCARYKEDAAKQSRLPDHHKMLECARWRQVLADEEAGQCRAQDVKSWADKMPESADVQPCQ
jgi:hypothetical protein